jgi:flagellar L-ring protein precursor FlgH
VTEPPASPPTSFVADRKAHRVGDLVTVLISESATASSTARTRTDKGEKAGLGVSSKSGTRVAADADISRSFSGGGQVERSGRVVARVAASVVEADPSGRLRITGEQLIVMNDERQRVRLDGYIRAEDIASDNTISSGRVALARIEISGKGVLADGQSPGWLARLFMWAKQ